MLRKINSPSLRKKLSACPALVRMYNFLIHGGGGPTAQASTSYRFLKCFNPHVLRLKKVNTYL